MELIELPAEATEEMIDAVHNEVGAPKAVVVLTREGAANVWRTMVWAYQHQKETA